MSDTNDKRERFNFGLLVKLTNPDEKAKEQEKAAQAAASTGLGGKPVAPAPPAATAPDAAKAPAGKESKP